MSCQSPPQTLKDSFDGRGGPSYGGAVDPQDVRENHELSRLRVLAHPLRLRMLSLLVFLIGCAALYRVAWRLGGRWAAVLAVPAYGALGYAGVNGVAGVGWRSSATVRCQSK